MVRLALLVTALAVVPGLAAAQEGGELYILRGCLGCHGATGRGGVGPPLAQTPLTFDAFVKQVRQPRGIMPPFPAEVVFMILTGPLMVLAVLAAVYVGWRLWRPRAPRPAV